jgi:hypothetical protein
MTFKALAWHFIGILFIFERNLRCYDIVDHVQLPGYRMDRAMADRLLP